MKTCLDCIHHDVCNTLLDDLLSVNRNKEPCDQFDDKAMYTKLPVYIGQKLWSVFQWFNGEVEIREGHVSMIQQKADKSWKFRASVRGSVYDCFFDRDVNEHIFFTLEAAEAKAASLRAKEGINEDLG